MTVMGVGDRVTRVQVIASRLVAFGPWWRVIWYDSGGWMVTGGHVLGKRKEALSLPSFLVVTTH